ncbi:MAG: flippase [Chloroflexi bacterium]|nr:flippase [Chloroflexota bacterium]
MSSVLASGYGSSDGDNRPWRSRLGLTQSLRQGIHLASWLLAGQVAVSAAQFASSMIRARGLSVHDFGEFAYAAALVSLFAIIADFGITLILVRELSRASASPRPLLQTATGLSLAMAAVAVAAVAATLTALHASWLVTCISLLFCGQLVVSAFGAGPIAYNRARHDTAYEALGRLGQAATLAGGGWLLLQQGASAVSFALLGLAGVVVSLLPVVGRAAATLGFIGPRLDPRVAARLLSAAWPVGAGMIATGVYYYFDTLFMAALGQTRAVALYSASYVLLFGATTIVSVLQSAFMPILSKAAVVDRYRFGEACRSFVGVSALGALALCATGPLAAPYLLRGLYGPAFADAVLALRILFVTGGVMFLSSAFGTSMLALGKQRQYLGVVAAGAAINVALNFALIPAHSLNGAATATLLAEASVCVLMAWRLRRAVSGDALSASATRGLEGVLAQ